MNRLEAELKQLFQEDPELAQILKVYSEIEQVYWQLQEAMGTTGRKVALEVRNSADVSLVFNSEFPISTAS